MLPFSSGYVINLITYANQTAPIHFTKQRKMDQNTTLPHLIGQLFILGFKGESVAPEHPIINAIIHLNLGGVILFDRLLSLDQKQNNIISPMQVNSLCSKLQENAKTPLLVAVDQEGGMVRRLRKESGFPETTSAEDMGKRDDLIHTSIHAACTAISLQQCGINLNLAPVVDLNSFPENPVIGNTQRSFSHDPACVLRHTKVWINEHRKCNILSCLKHFPGHGSSQTDSHLGFTDVSKSWHTDELTPFKELIREGYGECVMMGHLFHEGLDPRYPASLSPVITTTLLRKQLHYDGLILTDDIQMKAITDNFGLAKACCLALAAGADMIIIGNNLNYTPDIIHDIIPAIIQEVRQGILPEARIYESWNRVQQLKTKIQF